MGDRTNIADALDKFDHCTGGWVCPAVAHFHGCHCDDGNCDRPAEHTAVPLRADPDTSDELAAEARRLLDAATPGPWKKDRGTWDAANDTTDVRVWPKKLTGLSADEIAVVSTSWIGASGADRKRARANAALIAAAPRLIAALLERAVTAEADRDEAERRERTAVNLANYHRGVAREAGRRADAARPPAPTESTPDPPYQPVAGRPTMDLLDRGTDR